MRIEEDLKLGFKAVPMLNWSANSLSSTQECAGLAYRLSLPIWIP